MLGAGELKFAILGVPLPNTANVPRDHSFVTPSQQTFYSPAKLFNTFQDGLSGNVVLPTCLYMGWG